MAFVCSVVIVVICYIKRNFLKKIQIFKYLNQPHTLKSEVRVIAVKLFIITTPNPLFNKVLLII